MWYTHKNPYGCWICDAFFIARQLLAEAMDLSRTSSESRENNGLSSTETED